MSVRLHLSTNPSDWGMYGAVRDALISSKSAMPFINSDLNSGPWSEWRTLGTPHLRKTSVTITSAIVIALWFEKASDQHTGIATTGFSRETQYVHSHSLHGRPHGFVLHTVASGSLATVAELAGFALLAPAFHVRLSFLTPKTPS